MKYIFLILTAITLQSCNFNANATFENEQTAKTEAESVIGQFYLYTERGDFESAMPLFSQSFLKEGGKDGFMKFLNDKKNEMGDFDDYSLVDWKTSRVTGTDPKTEYLFVYKVKYTNETATETISLIKENNEVKIFGYNVQLDEKNRPQP